MSERLLLPAIVCILMIAALSFALFGFRRYVNHCYVASWLERCQPYMTVEDVFSVLPDRFYRDCPVTQVDCAMPYVCFLPSDCSKLEIEYACRLRSDVDRLSLFLESCSLYFDKDRRLVGICYCPHNNTLDNKSWEQFVDEQGGQQQLNMMLMLETRQQLVHGFVLDAVYKHFSLSSTDDDVLAVCKQMNPQAPSMVKEQMERAGMGYALRESAARLVACNYLVEHADITYLTDEDVQRMEEEERAAKEAAKAAEEAAAVEAETAEASEE